VRTICAKERMRDDLLCRQGRKERKKGGSRAGHGREEREREEKKEKKEKSIDDRTRVRKRWENPNGEVKKGKRESV
jgi:hypothetical protein